MSAPKKIKMGSLLAEIGQKVVIAFDPEVQEFRGEFVGFNGGADFYTENVKDLES